MGGVGVPYPTTSNLCHNVTYSLGGNDKYGDCAFVSVANHIDLAKAALGTPQEVSEAEAEYFYSVEKGFTPTNPLTDTGEVLSKVVKYFADNGWPADPTYKPLSWGTLDQVDTQLVIECLGATYNWLLLPQDQSGYNFRDDAVTSGAQGVEAHAVLTVQKLANSRKIVTWAEVVEVSDLWWSHYSKPDAYWVHLPDWQLPEWLIRQRGLIA